MFQRRYFAVKAFVATILLVLVIAQRVRVEEPGAAIDAPVLKRANPWDIGMNWKTLSSGYEAIRTAIKEEAGPGAVALVAKEGVVIRRRAFGYAQLYGDRKLDEEGTPVYTEKKRRMRVDTIFDLASVTKVVATSTAVQLLVQDGKIDLDAAAATYVPEFAAEGKEAVTIRQLLTHTSGLPAWAPLYDFGRNRDEVWAAICEMELDMPPGYARVYSCMGFITLGRIVEEVSGERLDRFTEKRIFKPLGMKDTGYRPPRRTWKRCATTEYSDIHGRFMCGQVHDENAYALGGISGNAGLFSTVDDLAIFCQMLLNRGAYGNVRILEPESVDRMLTPQLSQDILGHESGSLKGREMLLGWWAIGEKMEPTSIGGLPSPRAFGHSGFTGTSVWIDPEHNCFSILLTNAVHPSRHKAVRSRFREGFYQAVWDAVLEAEG